MPTCNYTLKPGQMKVLVTSHSFGRFEKTAIGLLEDNGFAIEYVHANPMTPEVIASRINGVDCLIVGNDKIDERVFAAADRLKLIHMHGTGLDGIDMDCANRHGVLVSNVTGANRNAVAEMTLALMLIVGRRIDKHISLLQEGRWERTAGNEISGSTVGIIGLGNIGRRLVELLQGFRVSMVGFDITVDPLWAQQNHVAITDSMDDVFRAADFLVLSLPLNEKTRNLVNDRTLSLMKHTAYLINTARGGLVDEQALSRAIIDKRIKGAALDAYVDEPPRMDSPLRNLDIVMTPHIAATSCETSSQVSLIVARQVIDILKHHNLALAVNHEAIAKFPGDRLVQ